MLIAHEVPQKYLLEAANHATFVLNGCLISYLTDMALEEAWKERNPIVSHLKVFGCIGYVHIPYATRQKLGEKSIKCVHMGDNKESKAYCMDDPKTKKIIITNDVVFDEMEK